MKKGCIEFCSDLGTSGSIPLEGRLSRLCDVNRRLDEFLNAGFNPLAQNGPKPFDVPLKCSFARHGRLLDNEEAEPRSAEHVSDNIVVNERVSYRQKPVRGLPIEVQDER